MSRLELGLWQVAALFELVTIITLSVLTGYAVARILINILRSYRGK